MIRAFTSTDKSGDLVSNPRLYLQTTFDVVYQLQEVSSCLVVSTICYISSLSSYNLRLYLCR